MSNKLFFIIFLLLWLGPIIGGVIVAKKKNRSPHWFWFGLWPGAGLWVFIIFLFLKPLEICENCNRKIPADAKVCPYCTRESALSTKSKEELADAKKKQKMTILITVLIIIAIFVLFITILFTSIGTAFKTSVPYKHSIELIENNQAIMDYLGNDYKQKGMMAGSISSSGTSSGKAVFSYKIKGKNGISMVYIDAYKENGIWNYNKINFYKESKSSDLINLLEPVSED